MPRPPRVWFPGAWYHVMARGNNRERIFRVDADYRRYLGLMKEALTRYECRLHAYALMTNHVHLMVETGQTHSISRAIQWLHTSYSTYVNRRHDRVGHVFQGRYRSEIVDRDTYALELSRYIHLNPVRAALSGDPAIYRWSSCRAYLTAGGDHLVTTTQLLSMSSQDSRTQRSLYRRFVLDGLARGQTPIGRGGQTPSGGRGLTPIFLPSC